MNLPNFHIGVSPWVLFTVMLGDVGLVTFGDPAAYGAPSIATPVFKSVLAMLGVALTVMTVGRRPPTPAMPD